MTLNPDQYDENIDSKNSGQSFFVSNISLFILDTHTHTHTHTYTHTHTHTIFFMICAVELDNLYISILHKIIWKYFYS